MNPSCYEEAAVLIDLNASFQALLSRYMGIGNQDDRRSSSMPGS